MARAAIVLLHDNRVALISRVRRGLQYFLFPGGHVEEGEATGVAAAREALEELGLYVRVGALAATVQLLATPGDGPEGRPQYYFWAETVSGEFGTGLGAELSSPAESASGSYTPVWLPLGDFPAADIRPRALADALATRTFSPTSTPLEIVETLPQPAVASHPSRFEWKRTN